MQKSQKTVASVILCLTLLAAGRAAAAQEFRVEGAGLVASPASYAGPCPGLITFRGKIQAGAAGRVKYTYVYSDGGGGPEGFVDFAGPGVKEVETTWRLGDARTLPRYDGWAVLKIISPNPYQSNRAAFALECKPGDGQPQTPTPNAPPDNFAQTYLAEVPRISADQRQRFTAELDRLKAFSEELQQKLSAAPQQPDFDAKQLGEELRSVAGEHDEEKRAERGKALGEKYGPRFKELFRASGVDLESERRRAGALLASPSNDPPRTVGLLGFFLPAPARTTPTQGPPPSPDITEQVYVAPYTSNGVLGDRSEAHSYDGSMRVRAVTVIAGSVQRLAFITQSMTVERGVRRVRVSATLEPVFHSASTASGLGYASAETIVNMRVMEGSRQLCGDSVSLGRSVAVVAGGEPQSGNRTVVMQCELTRASPDTPTTYQVVAELEGWAGAGGLASAAVYMSGTLTRLQVLLDRR